MYWLCAVLDGVVVCGGRMGAVRIPAPDAAERTKLLEDLHDRHFFALQVLSGGVPLHQVAEVLLAEGAALGRLEVVHQREKMRSHSEVSAGMISMIATRRSTRIQEWEAVFYPVEQLNSV